ncbi:MAG TPA: Zn-ribbon domain-containing OB-fold protein [Candidatus Diapherotrites archaeon]|uniref:Zn-ribbon domain-containing OB-fold protein n=1 Tax=Candidatus Iainarchaeum sp. TaxID=3101447 RepID=A0A7J4JEY3_9ARCH|nr:Zn-ribbon domain-containing OB-fold protein [Candidatus Diapherotrites archaeon]HIH16323.1 Zn-ribbon domain-containing OB-fold protein [Candidatus Diapherotrites archaeon]
MFEESAVIRWRKYTDRYRLIGNACKACGETYYPAKEQCPCGGKEFAAQQFSGKGRLLTFTEVKAAPEVFESKTPYVIGIVKLDEGPKVGAQICDANAGDLKIGQRVEAVFRKFYASGETGVLHYGTKFRPVF